MRKSTGGARILGIHLETPFVSEERRGAIPTERLEPPSQAKLDEILTECAGNLRIFTLAPELPGALELFPELIREGIIISLGHTDATYEEAKQAIALGASHVTHLFNAMRPFHHREPGVLGAIFDSPQVSVQIIADGVHLHPATLRLAFALKGREKIALITDAVRGAGIDQKVFLSSSIRRRVEVKEGAPRLASGQIAGSILTMDKAVRNIQDFAGASLIDAAFMASTTPAKILKLDRETGSIEAGKDGDIVLVNEAGEVQMTLIKGEVVHDGREN
jgi:N-acetylglucosamine-6-phosphate deacetylase